MTRRPATQRGRQATPGPDAAVEPATAVEPAAPAGPVVPSQRLALDGELTIHTAAERRGTLLAAIEALVGPGAPEHEPIELDLSEVSELDTAGVQILLVAQREVLALGRSLRLVGAHSAVAEVLAIAHLTDLAGDPVATHEESSR